MKNKIESRACTPDIRGSGYPGNFMDFPPPKSGENFQIPRITPLLVKMAHFGPKLTFLSQSEVSIYH